MIHFSLLSGTSCSVRDEAKSAIAISGCVGLVIGMNQFSSDCSVLNEVIDSCVRPILTT